MTAMALQIVELLRLKYVSRETVCDTGESFLSPHVFTMGQCKRSRLQSGRRSQDRPHKEYKVE